MHELGFCVPDENWKCIDCGADIPQPELPPDFNPNLGNIIEIHKLINETRKVFDKIIRANTDPRNPKLPRLRMVGGQMLRLPHKVFLADVVKNSYPTAKELGYRGSIIRWGEMILEHMEAEPTIRPHQTEI